jgi:selenocysteine-specific elongation factor
MHIIATAGHVDHGKSTLVRALTGTDPDRWAEEKARGLTIDLGFAHLRLASGRELSFIDVPGHVRFLKNMLAGVGALDACLFVVAATEGWKPQSEEHLRILELLGVSSGIVALTKVDLADGELTELAALDVEEQVAGTFLEGAPVVPVAATTGRGLDELRVALDELGQRTPEATDRGRPRLWVDRSFAPAGAGTVVTGTLTGGSLAVGDLLTVSPAGLAVRVRALQTHHRGVDAVGPGHRVAVNLTGVAHHDLRRGDVVVHADQWHHTRTVDASFEVLASLDHPVSRRGAYLLYVGSAEIPVRLRVLGERALDAGERGLVRLHLDRSVPVLPGDRFIVRESGRDETVGGGTILDIDPQRPASRARPDADVDRVVAERGWVEVDLLERLTGERRPATVSRWVVAPEQLAATTAEVEQLVAGSGPLGLDVAVLDERQRAVLDTLAQVTVRDGRATIGPVRDPLADHPWVAALEASPFTPPGPEGVDRTEVRELVRRGLVVEEDGVHFAVSAVDEAGRVIASLLSQAPEGVTVATIRDALGTTRKFVLPLLSRLDRTGVTRRRGDLRVGGPRLPAPR